MIGKVRLPVEETGVDITEYSHNNKVFWYSSFLI